MTTQTNYKYGYWRDTATKTDWKKYFRSKDRAMFGVLGNSINEFDYRQFAKYELTTKQGYKNTFEDMVKDHKKLMRQLKIKGLDLDYCAVPELSPKNKLVHIHGIIRNNLWHGKTEIIIDQKELSTMWAEIHGAPIVFISHPYSFEDAIGYMTKHLVKEYPVTSKLGFRMMTSHGWLPKNCELARTIVVKAGNYRNQHVGGVDVKETWERVNKSFERWLKGQNSLPMRIYENEPIFLRNQNVVLLKGGMYDIEEYAIRVGIKKVLSSKKKK